MMFETGSASSSSVGRSLSSRYFRSESGSIMQYSISNITDDDSWLVQGVTRSEEDDIVAPRAFRNFPPPKLDVTHHPHIKGSTLPGPSNTEREYRDYYGDKPPRRLYKIGSETSPRGTIHSDSVNYSEQSNQRKSYRFSFQGEDSDNLTTPVIRNSSSKSPFSSQDDSMDNFDIRKWYSKVFDMKTDESRARKSQRRNRDESWRRQNGEGRFSLDYKNKYQNRQSQVRAEDSPLNAFNHSSDATNDASQDSIQSVLDYCSSVFSSLSETASSLEQRVVRHLFPYAEEACCSSSSTATNHSKDRTISTHRAQKSSFAQYGYDRGESKILGDDGNIQEIREGWNESPHSREGVIDELFSAYSEDEDANGGDHDGTLSAISPKHENVNEDGGEINGGFTALSDSSYKLNRAKRDFIRSSSSGLREQVSTAVASVKSTMSEARDNFEESGSMCFVGRSYVDPIDPIDTINPINPIDSIDRPISPAMHEEDEDTIGPLPVTARDRYLYPPQSTPGEIYSQNTMEESTENLTGTRESRNDSPASPNVVLEGAVRIDHLLRRAEYRPNVANECASTITMVKSLGGKSIIPVSTCKSPRLAVHKKKLSLLKLSSAGNRRGNWRKKIYS